MININTNLPPFCWEDFNTRLQLCDQTQDLSYLNLGNLGFAKNETFQSLKKITNLKKSRKRHVPQLMK